MVLTCVLVFGAIGALFGGVVGANISEQELGYIDPLWVTGAAVCGAAAGAAVGRAVGSLASAIGIGATGKITGTLTPGLYHSWQQAEQALHDAYSGIMKGMSTPYGWRFIDCFSNGISREAKYGFQRLTARILSQIEKDAWLLMNGFIESVEWHFYWSEVSQTGGATQELIDALINAGFKVFFH